MNTSLLILLSFLIGGGGSDLLDYVSTASYWQRDDTPANVAAMQEVLAPVNTNQVAKLIDNLGSDQGLVREDAGEALIKLGPACSAQLQRAAGGANPQVAELAKLLLPRLQAQVPILSVRRLMAIRTLGELKDASALGTLRPLLAATEPFEVDYAATAIALIDGKALPHPLDPAARDDVWLLPSNTRAVAQLSPRGVGPLDYDAAAKQVHFALGDNLARALATVHAIALSAAEQLGNLRLDAISAGLTDDFGTRSRCFVAILTGEFDRDRVAEFAIESKVPFHTISGIDVFESGDNFVFMPGSHRLVFAAPLGKAAVPLATLVAALVKSQPALKDAPSMVELIGERPDASPLWAAVAMKNAFKVNDALELMNNFRVTSAQIDGKFQLTIASDIGPAANSSTAIEAIDHTVSDARRAIAAVEQSLPQFSEASAFLRSYRSSIRGNGTVLSRAELSENPDALWMLPLFIMSQSHDGLRVP